MAKDSRGAKWLRSAAVLAVLLVASSCAAADVSNLADDKMGGRNDGTPGSVAAQNYIIEQLDDIAIGANPAATGPDAFRFDFVRANRSGTNVIAIIEGTDRADEWVVVGAHYDHIGSNCPTDTPGDTICNGATDNAAGVGIVLDAARSIAQLEPGPSRSVMFAFWDLEEDGLLGSIEFVNNPIIPLADIVTYVNFDIQGSNLLPSLRNFSAAVGAESGGPALQAIVDHAIDATSLDTRQLSAIFGQGRSDYQPFLSKSVPTVFFSDSTGPCYHTAQDDMSNLDQKKLARQAQTARRIVRTLAATNTRPTFVPGTPLATFQDAEVILDLLILAETDFDRFTATQQAQALAFRASLQVVVDEGPANFDSNDINSLLGAAVSTVSMLSTGECDGFLEATE